MVNPGNAGAGARGAVFVHAWLMAALLALAFDVRAQDNAQDMVRDATTRAIDALLESKPELERNPQRIYGFVEEYLLPYFDFEYSSRLVLGRHWRRASPAERERFEEAFREMLIRTYASAMLQYSDQEIEFLPYSEPAPEARDTTVRTAVETNSGPVPVDYNLRRSPEGGWKVFDVVIDGISVVVNYRSTFATEIRRLNGLSGLIEEMENRNRRGIVLDEPAPDFDEPAPGIE